MHGELVVQLHPPDQSVDRVDVVDSLPSLDHLEAGADGVVLARDGQVQHTGQVVVPLLDFMREDEASQVLRDVELLDIDTVTPC